MLISAENGRSLDGDVEAATEEMTAAPPRRDERRAVVAGLFAEHVPLWVAVHVIAATALALTLWSSVPRYLIVAWLTFLTLNAAAHLLMLSRFRGPHAVAQWRVLNDIFTAIFGLAWGVGTALFLAHLLPADRWLPVMAAVLTVGCTAPLTASAGSNLMFYLLCGLAPPLVVLLDGSERILPGATAVAGACVYLVMRAVNRAILDTATLLHEHLQVGRGLAAENVEQRARNGRLRREVEAGARALLQTQQEKERAFATLQALGEGVVTTDVNGLVDYLNPIAEVLTGWGLREVRGRALMSVLHIVNRVTGERPLNPIEQCLITERIVIGDDDTTLIRRDGVEYAIEHVASPIRDARDRFTGAALIFRDVTEKREMQSRLNWVASHDALTGLINRREFELRLQRLVDNGSRTGRTHVLCYIDLDHFKTINDSCGHPAGDEMLKSISTLLQSQIRDADTLARIGGDEFAALFYCCPLEKARAIAEALRQLVIEHRLDWDGKSLSVGASFGLVEITADNRDLTELLAAADIACYAAKNDGRNRVHVFEPDEDLIRRTAPAVREDPCEGVQVKAQA